jgi:bacteriocin-like protein
MSPGEGLKGASMGDQKQKPESNGTSSPVGEDKVQGSTKLSEEELQKVSGGKVTFQDFPYVKKVDKSSPL